MFEIETYTNKKIMHEDYENEMTFIIKKYSSNEMEKRNKKRERNEKARIKEEEERKEKERIEEEKREEKIPINILKILDSERKERNKILEKEMKSIDKIMDKMFKNIYYDDINYKHYFDEKKELVNNCVCHKKSDNLCILFNNLISDKTLRFINEDIECNKCNKIFIQNFYGSDKETLITKLNKSFI